MIRHTKNGKALILAAHGSTHEPGVNTRIQTLAEQIRNKSDFSEVIAAFHQGSPRFCEALHYIESDQVCVVPLMTSEGYYATQQLPAALAMNSRFEKVNLWQTRPVGTHPLLAATLAHRVEQLAFEYDVDVTGISLALVGHGTSRHAASRHATRSTAESVQQRLSKAQVFCAFIDDQPPVESILHRAAHQSVIVIPFLMGGGTHAVQDLPRRLGLTCEPQASACAVSAVSVPLPSWHNIHTKTGDATTFLSQYKYNSPISGYVDGKLLIVDYPVGHYAEMADWVISLATTTIEVCP